MMLANEALLEKSRGNSSLLLINHQLVLIIMTIAVDPYKPLIVLQDRILGRNPKTMKKSEFRQKLKSGPI